MTTGNIVRTHNGQCVEAVRGVTVASLAALASELDQQRVA